MELAARQVPSCRILVLKYHINICWCSRRTAQLLIAVWLCWVVAACTEWRAQHNLKTLRKQVNMGSLSDGYAWMGTRDNYHLPGIVSFFSVFSSLWDDIITTVCTAREPVLA